MNSGTKTTNKSELQKLTLTANPSRCSCAHWRGGFQSPGAAGLVGFSVRGAEDPRRSRGRVLSRGAAARPFARTARRGARTGA